MLLQTAPAASCDPALCNAQTVGQTCVANQGTPQQQFQYCAGGNGSYVWQGASPQANGPLVLTGGGGIGASLQQLSGMPAGTVLIGGPDLYLGPTYAQNSSMYFFWRGSDNLVYSYPLTSTGQQGSTPIGICDPTTGACNYCQDSNGNTVSNCCTANSNGNYATGICNLVNYPVPGGTVNLCSPWGTQPSDVSC